MAYGSMTMEERLKEHIKEYSLENLLDLSLVKACFEDISKVLGIELLLTQRHGKPQWRSAILQALSRML